jgi:hypothetical protein
MDWNWFFSSLAQSVAAIVGIFAAFIITRVINNQTEFARKKERLKELLARSERFKDKFFERAIEWYSEQQLETNLEKLEDKLEDGQKKTAQVYYTEMHSIHFIPRKVVIEKIQETIDNFVRAEERSEETSLYQRIAPISSPAYLQMESQRNQQSRSTIANEGELIFSLISELKQHVRLLKILLTEIIDNPESSKLVSYSILAAYVLFLAGVICPLLFLPVYTDINILSPSLPFQSLKIILLVVVSVIFLFIMWQFWRVNNSLSYDSADIEILKKLTGLGAYSTYLEIMENNIQEISAERENEKTGRKRVAKKSRQETKKRKS